MTPLEVLMHCAGDRELVAEFDRLTSSNLSGAGTPIDLAIDKATGRVNADALLFMEFIEEVIFPSLSGVGT